MAFNSPVFAKLGSLGGGNPFGSGVSGKPVPLGGAHATFAQMGSNILGTPLGGFNYQDLLERMLGETAGLGATRREQINEGAQSLLGSSLADLQRRGLASSSINANVRRDVEEGRQNQLGDLEEDLARQRLGIFESIGSGALGFQEGLLGQLLSSSTALKSRGSSRGASRPTMSLIHTDPGGPTYGPTFTFADQFGNTKRVH